VAFWHCEPGRDAKIIEDIQILCSICHRVFLIYTELCDPAWLNQQRLQHTNVVWLLPGVHSELRVHTVAWQYHLWRMSVLYQELSEPLDQLKPHATKPRFFDVLLGKHKRHRAFVRDSILQHGIGDLCVCKIAGIANDLQIEDVFDCGNFVMEPGVYPVPDQPRNSITPTVSYQGRDIQLGCIIPISVYNNTAYSIIAETSDDNHTIFLTEKTAKPMIAKRLFIVFSAMGFLAYLRSLGFQTFGSVIDESYDLEPDPIRRWTLAFQQVLYLCEQPQHTILDGIKSTVEHNHALIMSNHLVDSTLSHIRECILQ
jgi:hypothetical protein